MFSYHLITETDIHNIQSQETVHLTKTFAQYSHTINKKQTSKNEYSCLITICQTSNNHGGLEYICRVIILFISTSS